MTNIECPHCQQQTITWQQKFKAGKWSTIYCPQCGGRACAQPIILAIMYFAYVWDITFFGFMAIYERSIEYAAALIVIAGILEFFIYYVPLSRMRKLQNNK